jgi:hypothetical protein
MSPAPGREVRVSARCATIAVALIMRTAIMIGMAADRAKGGSGPFAACFAGALEHPER